MENSDSKTRSTKRKIWKFILLGLLSLVVISMISIQIWKHTGSNKWEFIMEKDGVKMYALKVPGSSVKAFKAVFRSKYSSQHFVAALLDQTKETCAEWSPWCVDVITIKPWDLETLSKVFLTRYELFTPLSPREFLLKGQISQDRQSKAITLEFKLFPDLIPHNEGYVRLRHMRNIWRWIPLENGETEVEFVQDIDMSEFMGGLFPNWLFSLVGTDFVHSFVLDELPKLLDKEKYYHTKFDFVEDYIAELKRAEEVVSINEPSAVKP